ncbi:hypothetical protein GCM10028792_40870 [Salinisphaera aquimarina]
MLIQYRQHRGLPDLPSERETDIPLVSVCRTGRHGTYGPIQRATVHRSIKDVFLLAGDQVSETDLKTAQLLYAASPSWLRHTAAVNAIDCGTDLLTVKADMRLSMRSLSDYIMDTPIRLFPAIE